MKQLKYFMLLFMANLLSVSLTKLTVGIKLISYISLLSDDVFQIERIPKVRVSQPVY